MQFQPTRPRAPAAPEGLVIAASLLGCRMQHAQAAGMQDDSCHGMAGPAYKDPEPEQGPQAPEGLVIAASLLDKAPNLAGLSRSAEAFGAAKLLVSPGSAAHELPCGQREIALVLSGMGLVLSELPCWRLLTVLPAGCTQDNCCVLWTV